jgi:DNA-binding transcriptional MerR regulator
MRHATLPGSTIEAALEPGAADRQLTPMFSCGGLILSQVCQLTGLEGYTIQNWVKRKFLSPPEKKKYARCQLCRIFNINLLKDTFTLEQAVTLLQHVNGSPNGAAGDLVDDSRLYGYLVDCLAALNSSDLLDPSRAGETIRAATADCQSTHRGAEIQLRLVLEIMLTACQAQQVRRRAVEMFERLDSM